MNRRDFFQNSILSTATLLALPEQLDAAVGREVSENKATGITDTYVNLFDWPFRPLKYANTAKLTAKLAKHSVKEAWAGSFEALFYKNIDHANAKLAAECKKSWPMKLLPVGTVNTTWPDWEEDLRRCGQQYGMTGIRIFPSYQMIQLNSPEFQKLVEEATKMKMFIQIVGDVEDPRHNHPLVNLAEIKYDPLLDIAKKIPNARIQLVHWNRKVSNPLLEKIVRQTNIKLDISRIEGAGELGRLIEGNSWFGPKNLSIPVDRLMFGSHAPFFPLESALFKLFESPLTEAQSLSIIHGNAHAFKTA